jgi:hypothetical protein
MLTFFITIFVKLKIFILCLFNVVSHDIHIFIFISENVQDEFYFIFKLFEHKFSDHFLLMALHNSKVLVL